MIRKVAKGIRPVSFPFLHFDVLANGIQNSWDEQVFEIVTRAQARGVWSNIYVGGCCRAGLEEITNLRKRIDEQ